MSIATATLWVGTAAPADGVPEADALEFPEAFEVCASCHAYLPNEPPLVGPPLWQVVGRDIASVEGYDYSDALKSVDGTWDRATLDRFLADPQAFAPGARIEMRSVRNTADRAEILNFLETLVPGEAQGTANDD